MLITVHEAEFENKPVTLDINYINQIKEVRDDSIHNTQILLRHESIKVVETVAEIKQLLKEAKGEDD